MSISQVSSQEHVRSRYGLIGARSAAAGAPPTKADISAAPATDAVSISPAGRALAAERARAERADGTRDERIDSLKAAIAAGTYDVTSRTLATTLVKNFAQ